LSPLTKEAGYGSGSGRQLYGSGSIPKCYEYTTLFLALWSFSSIPAAYLAEFGEAIVKRLPVWLVHEARVSPEAINKHFMGDFFGFLKYFIQHCFI